MLEKINWTTEQIYKNVTDFYVKKVRPGLWSGSSTTFLYPIPDPTCPKSSESGSTFHNTDLFSTIEIDTLE